MIQSIIGEKLPKREKLTLKSLGFVPSPENLGWIYLKILSLIFKNTMSMYFGEASKFSIKAMGAV